MPILPHRQAWIQIHICVVLWGFTAVIGRLITLPAQSIAFWRMCAVAIILALTPMMWKALLKLSWRYILLYLGIGSVVALHWLTFYGAVKLANASVAATCIATVPIFLCVVEPVLTSARFQWRQLLFGLLVLPGIALVVGSTPEQMNLGIALGVFSALLVAVFSSLNKKFVSDTSALCITALEMAGGAVFLLLLAAVVSGFLRQAGGVVMLGLGDLFTLPNEQDLLLLLVLSVLCTLLPFVLVLSALRYLSAFATALVVNLEPIYAILLAVILLNEQHELAWGFYLGVCIILAVVFAYPLLTREDGKPHCTTQT